MAEEVPVVLGDRPLDTPDVDLFGYAPFARMLSYSVLRGSPANGLVVGVYGDWDAP